MSLAGEGAVAIWHDVVAEGREEFYAWHGIEHMPERVGIPGFVRGRRYIAVDAELEFFNLYEAVSPQVVSGSDYRNRLNNPTPWTRSSVAYFRNVARSVCKVSASFGQGCGGLMATWRYDVADADRARHEQTMTEQRLAKIAGQRGIAGAHLLVADLEASSVKTEEERARTQANRIPGWILLIEGWGEVETLAPLCREDGIASQLVDAGATAASITTGLYQLQNTRLKTAWSSG